MVDHSQMKLGKLPPQHDPSVPKMAMFLSAPTPATFPANYAGAEGKVKWQNELNQKLGCCTICGVANKTASDTALVRTAFVASTPEQLALYEKWDGYDPSDASTDQGGVEAEVLAKWYDQGFYGHYVIAYASVNWRDHDEFRHACSAVNGCYIGVALPLSAQSQSVWGEGGTGGDTTPGSWGGHCVYVYGYTSNSDGSLKTVKFVSWSKEMEMTAAFWDQCVDECWVVLLGAWIKGGKTPAGLNVAALTNEIQRLKAA